MFAGWGTRVARLRWSVLVVALVAVLGAGVWGVGVFDRLTEGGYSDPDSESARAADVVATALGGQSGDVIAIYTPDRGTIDDAALAKRITARLGELPGGAVVSTASYWDDKAPRYAAADRSSAAAVITLAGADDAEKMTSYADIEESLGVPGAHLQLAGSVPLSHASNERSADDLVFAEMISLPIVLVLLLFIFGSLVAASLPVLIGGAAVLGSLGVLHTVALTHEVNSFAVNVASLLGLGMAIDYGLFMVGRFREEQAAHPTAEAIRRTVATAGRTVLFSATLLMTALAGLLLFPQGFLKSLAYGGLAAVFLAMLLSLTLLPAVLAILGPRVDKLPVRLPARSATGRGWSRLAGVVLRRPVLVAVPILAGLLVLALPIGGVRFGENDERVLPSDDPSRVAIETLKAGYPQFSTGGVQIVMRGVATDDARASAMSAFSDALAKVPGVTEVTTTGVTGDLLVLNAALADPDPFSAAARQAVDDLRALPAPAGADVLIGGATARNVDSIAAIAAKLPLMIGLLAGATLVLMFLAFGSILLPIKAVVMSALSLTATFGILIWIFQDGHGAGLLNVTPAPLEAGIVVLMAAVVFGLSTDYEVFLLSRMVEARVRGATTAEAVTIGLTRTGRVISAAALLLIVVTGAFALSSVTTMRFVGVGMIIALLLDATVVRMLLVPAVLALFGDAAWWAPGPLRRLQERAGLAEHAAEPADADADRATDADAGRTTRVDDTGRTTHVDDTDRATRMGGADQGPRHAAAALPGRHAATALPGRHAAAALPAGQSAGPRSFADYLPADTLVLHTSVDENNTVVLDYDDVLDYLAEKERVAAMAVSHAGDSQPDDAEASVPTSPAAPDSPEAAVIAGAEPQSPEALEAESPETRSPEAPEPESPQPESPEAQSPEAAVIAVAQPESAEASETPAIAAAVEASLPADEKSSLTEDSPVAAEASDSDRAASEAPEDLTISPAHDSEAIWAEVEATLAAGAEAAHGEAPPVSTVEATDPPATEPAEEPVADQPVAEQPVKADQPAAAAPEEAGPVASAEPVAAVVPDPFAWRKDPRLANLAAPAPDDFGWLPSTTPPSPEPAEPAETTQPAEPAETAQPAEPAEDATPASTADAEPRRPQTLDDLLSGTAVPVSAAPAASRRPQTLDEWLSGPRPQTLGDVPAKPGPAPENPAHFARPQTLDDWLSGPKPPTPRPQTLADQPKSARPKGEE
ncbi:putative membrane protein [Actinoplanes missouriensis 431]|uniref:Putative membrane protein n=1 Tax=Actinoplanes missouriensis (strain ATCC 14538 / DSM 43046 / CBS 188.64 / JCM 3121 / NBRC 102363 / NCIMB 12654 / NRRL B-3342 / UNCC 431) TaxID=512565 RepID=I0HAK8_ACTM4|nr:MMPL family transporter [Actinoplanes missouriensis]BAL90045.1 putative membrane protein [Actinoplanes missouriensis 431]